MGERLADLNAEALAARIAELETRYAAAQAQGLKLDMTRGKPCPEQLDLANGMLTILGENDFKSEGGTDCRNYGGLDGLPEARALFAPVLGVTPDDVIVGGSSSLQMMHDTVLRAMLLGVPGGAGPWVKDEVVKFICPCPGYDRHFAICQTFGIEMIPVAMTDTGPDMDAVEALVAADAAIKGLWLVPKYCNPTGATCSDETVDRLAKMTVAAPDFRLFWDNAYAVHHLSDKHDQLKSILAACTDAGNADRVYLFGSTSKVSFAGAGIGFMAASPTNRADILARIGKQTIGPDKLNQLRHARFFGDFAGLEAHMAKHTAILAPKFAAVLDILESQLGGKGIATWTNPNGGYFISLDGPDGCAAEVVKLAADAGVKLTGAGATFPGGNDPRDRNIRLAPTLPGPDEIRQAMDLVCLCVELVAARQLQS